MTVVRTPDGLLASLKPGGLGRFFSSAFLIFWLCGWAAGEFFAFWLLGNGLVALMSGAPLAPGRAPLPPGLTLAAGGFLLLWITLWTVGGVAAIAEVLRLLWGEDRLLVREARLRLERWRGPFRSSREFPRDAILRIFVAPRGGALALEAARERIVLSTLGTVSEREEAARALRTELALIDSERESAVLPKGWEEIVTPEGDRALVPDLGIRRKQALVLGVVTLLFAVIAVVLLRESWGFPALLPSVVLIALAMIGLGWGTAWLARGRMEWRVANGRLHLRRRFGGTVRDVFEAERLEVVVTTDSDGDEWCSLYAVRGPIETSPVQYRAPTAGTGRKRIAAAMNDPTVPLRLGAWLARAGNVPLADRTTKSAREKEVVVVREQLAASGRFGRFVVRLLDAAQKRGKQV
jgi:hypothetical protein